MPNYEVKVMVEFRFEVEAENEAEAEELGWGWEDHATYGETYSIEVEEMLDGEEL